MLVAWVQYRLEDLLYIAARDGGLVMLGKGALYLRESMILLQRLPCPIYRCKGS